MLMQAANPPTWKGDEPLPWKKPDETSNPEGETSNPEGETSKPLVEPVNNQLP